MMKQKRSIYWIYMILVGVSLQFGLFFSFTAQKTAFDKQEGLVSAETIIASRSVNMVNDIYGQADY
jgi:hypothetical protein